MNYQETINYLFALLPMFQRVGDSAFKKDLANTVTLCHSLGNPERNFKSIHIAGTNGKGSTAHTLAAIFQTAGYKTGLYTSPHLKSFTERIKINGNDIGEQDVVDFVKKIKPVIEVIMPSFFEMTVAMAFDYFARNEVDIAIIEVGMGGRYDSTNVIVPELSVITNISYDHQAFLGDTLPEIAFEKAGIIKPGVPVVVSERQPEVERVFIDKAAEFGAPIYFAEDHYQVKEATPDDLALTVDVFNSREKVLGSLAFDLKGKYQLKNIPGILKAVDVMVQKGYDISRAHIQSAFSQVRKLTGLKGRWEILAQKPLIICDTAHNEDGIRNIVKQINGIQFKQLHIVLGVVKDKNPEKVLKLLPQNARYYFTKANIPRALAADELQIAASKHGLNGVVVSDVNQAVNEAKKNASPDDLIFIGGSIFVVAEIEEL